MMRRFSLLSMSWRRSSCVCSQRAAAPRAAFSSSAAASPSVTADFRSDTVTVPSAEMLTAMSSAAVGDDVYAEDPTVNLLEATVAALTEKEAALFVCSGTMGNLLSVGAVCGRGDELLTADSSHIECHEAGGASALLGVKISPVPTGGGQTSVKGQMEPGQIAERVHTADNFQCPTTKMLCLENTNVDCGGTVLDLATMASTSDTNELLGWCFYSLLMVLIRQKQQNGNCEM